MFLPFGQAAGAVNFVVFFEHCFFSSLCDGVLCASQLCVCIYDGYVVVAFEVSALELYVCPQILFVRMMEWV